MGFHDFPRQRLLKQAEKAIVWQAERLPCQFVRFGKRFGTIGRGLEATEVGITARAVAGVQPLPPVKLTHALSISWLPSLGGSAGAKV